jgi:glycosyltransferase involved in cell wall biosynthesis
MGGYFRDRFEAAEGVPETLRVLFVSPYPICPPVHGGGVFMYQSLRALARLAEVHVVALLDQPWQAPVNEELREFCASAEFLVRMEGGPPASGSIVPHAVREFANEDLDWLIHRQLLTKRIDVLQLEYTPLAQYAGCYRRIATALFEHDVYFQSIARGLRHMRGPLQKLSASFEYLRALRYELRVLPRMDQVQTCTIENKRCLVSFLPELEPRLREGLRAGIDTTRYDFRPCGREPHTMLFLGSFRHEPNRVALDWFVRHILPLILRRRPEARLEVIGSDPPPDYAYGDFGQALRLRGFVEEIREPLARCAVFVCPIRSGSGVRVKLLEAFAAGIPVVSTRVGAEGLGRDDGEFCRLADEPEEFAACVLELFDHPDEAAEIARRARAEVAARWDMTAITRDLEASYREMLARKRLPAAAPAMVNSERETSSAG